MDTHFLHRDALGGDPTAFARIFFSLFEPLSDALVQECQKTIEDVVADLFEAYCLDPNQFSVDEGHLYESMRGTALSRLADVLERLTVRRAA